MSKQFKPTLCAQKATIADIQFPTWASTKLDGIRCVIHEDKPKSRELLFAPNNFIDTELSKREYRGLDGEIIVGPPNIESTYNSSYRGWSNRDGEPDFRFYVFDDFTDPSMDFYIRQDVIHARVCDMAENRIVHVRQALINSREELQAFYAKQVENGYEGLVCKAGHGKYKFGRSTINEQIAIKLKPKCYGEALVIGSHEGMQNNNVAEKDNLGHTKRSSHAENKTGKGVLGKWDVRVLNCDPDPFTGKVVMEPGVEFKIGGGTLFTAKFRELAWRNREFYENKLVVRFSFCPIGVLNKPRHPQADGLRDPSLGT